MSILKKLKKHNTPAKFSKAVYRKLTRKKTPAKPISRSVSKPKPTATAAPKAATTRRIAPVAVPKFSTAPNHSPIHVHSLDRTCALREHCFLPHPVIANRLECLVAHTSRTLAVIVFHADAGNTLHLGMRTEDFREFAGFAEAWVEARIHWQGKGFKDLHIGRKEFAKKIERTDRISAKIFFGDTVSVTLVINLYDRQDTMAVSADNKNEDLRFIRGALQDELDSPNLMYIEEILGTASAQTLNFPIDIVYTWVNHEDPDWQLMYLEAKAQRESELVAGLLAQTHADPKDDDAAAKPDGRSDAQIQAGLMRQAEDEISGIDQNTVQSGDTSPGDLTSGGTHDNADADSQDQSYDDEDSGGAGADEETDTAALSRFTNRQELKYSLRSVEQYMPWIRKIFIFSNCAKPQWLAGSENVIWVRHEDVIPEDMLPTFNSHAIESYLHKIPELSEHFIYFNDDFFVNQPVPYSLFFASNGVCQSNLEDYGVVNGIQKDGDPDYLNAARNGADFMRAKFGMSPTRLHKHSPYAMSKSVMAQMEEEFKEGFERTRKGKFRSSTDLSTASFLFHHYGYAQRQVAYGGFRAKLVKNTARNLAADFEMMVEGTSVRTFCLNDGNDSHDDDAWNEGIVEFLTTRFPLPTRAEMGMPERDISAPLPL